MHYILVLVGLVERIGVGGDAPRAFAGTPSYCSIDVQNGGSPSPKDEIEAMVVYLT
jgi:hypothetical protein